MLSSRGNERHLRSMGLGDPHEHGLIPTFVRVVFERQQMVLLLDFFQRCALKRRTIVQNLSGNASSVSGERHLEVLARVYRVQVQDFIRVILLVFSVQLGHFVS